MHKKHTDTYLAVAMPQRFALEFQLDDGSWMTEAICLADRFERLENGAYICSEFGSGLWIRCIERHEDHFVHIDGGGNTFRYRLIELPMSETS